MNRNSRYKRSKREYGWCEYSFRFILNQSMSFQVEI